MTVAPIGRERLEFFVVVGLHGGLPLSRGPGNGNSHTDSAIHARAREGMSNAKSSHEKEPGATAQEEREIAREDLESLFRQMDDSGELWKRVNGDFRVEEAHKRFPPGQIRDLTQYLGAYGDSLATSLGSAALVDGESPSLRAVTWHGDERIGLAVAFALSEELKPRAGHVLRYGRWHRIDPLQGWDPSWDKEYPTRDLVAMKEQLARRALQARIWQWGALFADLARPDAPENETVRECDGRMWIRAKRPHTVLRSTTGTDAAAIYSHTRAIRQDASWLDAFVQFVTSAVSIHPHVTRRADLLPEDEVETRDAVNQRKRKNRGGGRGEDTAQVSTEVPFPDVSELHFRKIGTTATSHEGYELPPGSVLPHVDAWFDGDGAETDDDDGTNGEGIADDSTSRQTVSPRIDPRALESVARRALGYLPGSESAAAPDADEVEASSPPSRPPRKRTIIRGGVGAFIEEATGKGANYVNFRRKEFKKVEDNYRKKISAKNRSGGEVGGDPEDDISALVRALELSAEAEEKLRESLEFIDGVLAKVEASSRAVLHGPEPERANWAPVSIADRDDSRQLSSIDFEWEDACHVVRTRCRYPMRSAAQVFLIPSLSIRTGVGDLSAPARLEGSKSGQLFSSAVATCFIAVVRQVDQHKLTHQINRLKELARVFENAGTKEDRSPFLGWLYELEMGQRN